jgi:hypothetical protein
MKVHRIVASIVFTLGFFVLPFGARAQQRIPLQNQPSATGAETNGLEVEQIEIRKGGAVPTRIHRPTGKFIILLINQTHDPSASFALDSAAVGEGRIGPNPLLRLAELGAASPKHQLAALADLPAGEYHLKSVATGKILCHITIE